MKTRIFTLSLCFIGLSTVNFAQQKVYGTVKDVQGNMLSEAEVHLETLHLKAKTNPNGEFVLNKVPAGTYTLHCVAPGYEIQKQQVQIAETDVQLDFTLLESALNIYEVFVVATRATQATGTTFTNISKEELNELNYGQDIPYLLAQTPSAVVSSDAGGGVGYTEIKIRGVDPTRTNVTVNGIPINDSESHAVYWVDLPDLGTSVDNIQIQRGVGTSTNGAAAFGASINIQTDRIQEKAYAVLDQSAGSFGTFKSSAKVGTGILNKHWAFDMRLSNIQSEGYIDRASSRMQSYYLSGVYTGKKSLLRANVLSGKEVTYQSWYGTPESVLYGTEADRVAYADRNYLSDPERDNLLNAGRTYNYYQYDNQVDDYLQSHYQLLHTYTFYSRLKLNSALHYTKGAGYYEQYRNDDDFSTYGLTPIPAGNDTITSTDLIRRRWLDNDFYGGILSLDYTSKKGLNLIIGGAYNQYEGKHFGEIIWARNASTSEIRDTYYDNDALKKEANVYVKSKYTFKKWSTYVDLQLRHVNYSFLGIDQVNNEIQEQNQAVTYNFFNPKTGVVYSINTHHSVYASYAIAQREPIRVDFRSSTSGNRPKHEVLRNLEAGYRFTGNRLQVLSNFYFMDYTDQLILTGKINDVGDYTRVNVDKSYRAGIELEAKYAIREKYSISGNLTLSQNKIASFTEYIDDYDLGGQSTIEHKNTDLAFSPNAIAALVFSAEPFKNFNCSLINKFVGQQFLDNTSTSTRKIDAYYLTHLNVSYTIKNKIGKELTFGVLVNNVFNQLYASNGYTWGYIYGGERTVENFYYPQAGINAMGRIQLKF